MSDYIEIFILIAIACGAGFGVGSLKKDKSTDQDKPEKDYESRLILERQNLYNMLDSLPMAFHLQASDYSVPFANKVFHERFGDPQKRMCYDLMHNRNKPCEVCSTFRVFDKREKVSTVWTDRDNRTYLTVCTPFKDVLKGEDLVMEMALDITELEEAKQSAIKAQEVAEKASKVQSEFLGQVSHEFRTPLNAMMGFAELLKREGVPDALRKSWLETILKSGDQLLVLVDNVLDYSRLNDSAIQLDMKMVEVAPLIQEVVETFDTLAGENEITLNTQLGDEKLFINVDPVWLKRILSNLISNAIKFNHQGGSAQISLGTVDENVLIVVEDTGLGIPKEDRGKIFEPFFRLPRDVNLRPGVGMGLSVSKRVVEKMNGTVDLDMELESGTRINLMFPSRIPH
jgi:signal transduction histidine kinase